MKLRVLAGAIALVLLFSLPALALEVQYEATLSGANESPAVPSPATGQVLVTIDLATQMMTVDATFVGLTDPATAAHIHCCLTQGGPLNVGVATFSPSFPNTTSGSYDMTFDLSQASTYNAAFITANGDVTGAMNALLAGLAGGASYFDVHDLTYPAGEIRGFLHVVPEPGMFALAALALGALSRSRRAH